MALERSRTADEVVEFCRTRMPGDYILVWYDDDMVWHERLLVASLGGTVWVIATPDGDRYPEDLGCRGVPTDLRSSAFSPMTSSVHPAMLNRYIVSPPTLMCQT
jgi:hypothetical protein